MKIYFEDGKLKNCTNEIASQIDLIIDATYGYSYCECLLRKMMGLLEDAVVYTNVITALNNCYAWSNELLAPEIYIRNKEGQFTRIDALTDRELREGHNIMKMYMNGEFDSK